MATNEALRKQKQEATGEVENANDKVTFVPSVDIGGNDAEITVVADMPGIDEQGIDVDLERDILTIRGHCTQQAPEGYTLAYKEFESGNFERSFRITEEIDRDGIDAAVKDGVLTIHLPKAKEAQPRKISVKAG